MKKNGYSIKELIILIASLGVVAIVIITKTSYAFKDEAASVETGQMYEVLKEARSYGNSLENLKKEKEVVISIKELMDKDSLSNKSIEYITEENIDVENTKIKISYDEETEEVSAMLLN